LIGSLAENVIRGCENLGLKRFDERTEKPVEIVSLIEQGWTLFLQRPDEYIAWEREALVALREA
jgi:hypothetical protein